MTETYGDSRVVDRVVLPFKTVRYFGDTGITIARLKDAKLLVFKSIRK